MNDTDLMIVAVVLAIGLVPLVIAGLRRHSYVAVILIGCVISIGFCLAENPVGIGIWVGMFVWAVWPKRVGFVAPLINATSSVVGRELGKHVKEYRDDAQTATDKLLILHDLHQRGVITDAEYQTGRDKLVQSILG